MVVCDMLVGLMYLLLCIHFIVNPNGYIFCSFLRVLANSLDYVSLALVGSLAVDRLALLIFQTRYYINVTTKKICVIVVLYVVIGTAVGTTVLMEEGYQFQCLGQSLSTNLRNIRFWFLTLFLASSTVVCVKLFLIIRKHKRRDVQMAILQSVTSSYIYHSMCSTFAHDLDTVWIRVHTAGKMLFICFVVRLAMLLILLFTCYDIDNVVISYF